MVRGKDKQVCSHT